MESESGTNITKISDSGYSHSGSNTTSQGSACSKSRHSGGSNSSRSSGYGGAPNPNEDGGESSQSQTSKRNKDRDHRKKKQKPSTETVTSSATPIPQDFTVPLTVVPPSVNITIGIETVPSPPALEIAVPECLDTTVFKNPEPLLTTVTLQPVVETVSAIIEEDNLHSWAEKEPSEKVAENEFNVEQSEPVYMHSSQPEVNDGFCCVISMLDGLVLYTTPSLTPVLGFPKDMWLGYSFIDFVHPKDRETFSSQVSTSVSLPLIDSQGKVKDVRDHLYVCLRRHDSVKSSAGINIEKPVSYQAFHLTVTIKQLTDSTECHLNDHNNGLFLVIIAVPVTSAYKVPRERTNSTKFGMRHTATGIFSYVDSDVVTNFGFLPQDMLGKSVFDFYHPDDMPFLKELYKSVMKTCQINGSVVRSKPYRFLVQNGCFALIETEWSSVVNPWSKRLEFVIGLHQILQGPSNPNVFEGANDKECQHIPEEVINQGKVMQAEIIQFLSQELPRPTGQDVSKRCRNLANFMESLMHTSKLEIDASQMHEFKPSISERDSVMLGEISPHHDFGDSKSSSETPPSYNQLNYNENISRFFQSNPKTTIASDESNSANNAMETDAKIIPNCAPNIQKCLSPIQNSGASGCDSAENLSPSTNPNLESGTTSGTNTSNDDFKPSHLTESVLVRHNEDMEKIMIQKHKKERSHIKDRETKKNHQMLEKYANEMLREGTNEHNQGVKRSGTHSRQDDYPKLSKLNHPNVVNHMTEQNHLRNYNFNQRTANIQNVQNPPPNIHRRNNTFYTGNDVHMWSSFSGQSAPNSQNPPPPPGFTANTSYSPNMFPVYYVPTFVQPTPVLNQVEPQKYQVQYMPANLLGNYNSMFLPPPILCPTVPIVPVPLLNPSSAMGADVRHFGTNIAMPKVNLGPPCVTASGPSGNGVLPSADQHQFGNNAPNGLRVMPECDRPSSQATSVKAEPGSRMGSIASASVVNKALSECSRKDLGLQSVCSPDTLLVSPPDGETQAEQFDINAKTLDTMKRPQQPETSYRSNRMDEESSCYSSSYSSLLKTDTTSGSNDDFTFNDNNTNRTDDERLKRNTYPMRKKDPPWVESVSVSSDLIYRYQVTVKDLEDILKQDLKTLKATEQPMMVNDQLHQLYIEMELEGLSKALTIEEGFSSSSSSSIDESPTNTSNSSIANKLKKKRRSYSSLMMIYEGDAPFPPPEAHS